jgi:hypothetical protein
MEVRRRTPPSIPPSSLPSTGPIKIFNLRARAWNDDSVLKGGASQDYSAARFRSGVNPHQVDAKATQGIKPLRS